MESMEELVLSIGVFTILNGVHAALRPEAMLESVDRLFEGGNIAIAFATRLVFGGLLLLAAGACRAPALIAILGAVILIPVVVWPLMGLDRVRGQVRRFVDAGAFAARVWSVVALAFGGLLIYGAGVW